MSGSDASAVNRRDFLQAGALATASALTISNGAQAADPPAAAKIVLPKRTLGKTGVDVTILNQGTWKSEGLDRILRVAYASGIRYFDTAKSYGSEPGFKRWFQAMPEVRKEIFLVTKDSPHEPRQLIPMLDERLEALGTDYVDLIFVHALGDKHSLDDAINFAKGKEFKEVAEAIRKSGKAKFVGFSSHHQYRPQILQAAAEGGFIDAIMLQYTPWLDKDAPLNKAIDACHKKGIGLVSMKQVAGNFASSNNKASGGVLDEVVRRVPMLKEKNLTPYQGLLHAIWTDERISSSCVSMRNTDQIRENADAARRFEPLKTAEIHQLRDATLAQGPTLCADCDGRCSLAAGTAAPLGDLTRLLTYFEHHGYKGEARRLYAEMASHERSWQGADLDAARAACPNGLDFAKLLPRVDEHLA
jgi:aryl-alcohol dehydrogenase-like predicted oxidoreductase